MFSTDGNEYVIGNRIHLVRTLPGACFSDGEWVWFGFEGPCYSAEECWWFFLAVCNASVRLRRFNVHVHVHHAISMQVGASQGIMDHLRGCAGASLTDEPESNEGPVVNASCSSRISIMASPLRVSSVFVGDAGDCGPSSASLTTVSPVIVRAGAI